MARRRDAALNYYEQWVGAYRKKTGRLRMLEHGAYKLLLDEYYAIEQPLPASLDDLYTICGARDKRDEDAVRKVANAYFPVGPDGLRHNERADEEIALAQPRIAASKANGRKGGRRKKTQQEPDRLPTGTHQQPGSNPPATHAVEAFPHTTDHKDQNLNPNVEFGEKPPPKLDVVPLVINPEKPPRLQAEAAELLAFLNERTGRHFRPTKTTLRPVMARLKEGYTLSECRAVVARKVRQWSADDKMRDYLRPATLFGAEKFAQYVGEVPPPEEIFDVV